MLSGDPCAVVVDGEDDLAADPGGGDGDVSAGGGVTQCVVEQVAQDLRQPLPVCPQRAARGGDVRCSAVTFLAA